MAWAALVAWLAACGLTADLLKVSAYAHHLADGKVAVVADDCGLCELAGEAAKLSQGSSLCGHDSVKAKVKSDGAVWSVRLAPSLHRPGACLARILSTPRCPELSREVPVPPPKFVA
jgi:membrane glycosyltransferase